MSITSCKPVYLKESVNLRLPFFVMKKWDGLKRQNIECVEMGGDSKGHDLLSHFKTALLLICLRN